MTISGFTFLRNAVTLDYPVVEAITAVLPVVDEFVVNVGRMPGEADDGTLDLVRSIHSDKIRIVQSLWNPNLSDGGYVYAQQTNIALCNCTGTWAWYVQCDEVVHEAGLDVLERAMSQYADDAGVDGLTLWQENFWGDYHTRFCVYPWTARRKCWIIKPHHFVLSRGDAANFTVHPRFKEHGRKLRVIETPAKQFHYGAVRSVAALKAKYQNMAQYWNDKDFDLDKLSADIHYTRHPRPFFERYDGSHPAVMQPRIAEHPITIDLDSPDWRTTLNRKERKMQRQAMLVKRLGDRWFTRGDYQLVGRITT